MADIRVRDVLKDLKKCMYISFQYIVLLMFMLIVDVEN